MPRVRRGALAAFVFLTVLALWGGAREAADGTAPVALPARSIDEAPVTVGGHAEAEGVPGGARVAAVAEAGPVVAVALIPSRAERQDAAARAEAEARVARQRLFAQNLASLETAAGEADRAGNVGYAQALRRRRDALVGRVQ